MRALLPALVVSLVVNAAPPVPRVVSSPNGQTSIMEAAMVCPTKNEKARKLYNDGNDAEEAGKVAEALKLFDAAAKLDPKFCDAMDNVGLMHRRQGDLDEAIAWYRKSLTVVSKNGSARMNLAAALRMKKDFDASAAEYAALIKVLPEDPEGYYGLASVKLDLDRPKEAVAPLLDAERLYLGMKSPYVSDARVLLGRTYLKLENWAAAAKYLALVVAATPNDANANLQLGTALVKLKKNAEARPYLNKVRALGGVVPDELATEAGL